MTNLHDPNWLSSLVPLKLYAHGTWDPAEHEWGDDGEPLEPWAAEIARRGPRPRFEMEQVLPGSDPGDPDGDPILEAMDLAQAGRHPEARRVLERLLVTDMRCLDAHAHLGNIEFEGDPAAALEHYERGSRIGELTVPRSFEGVLPWSMLDNRPFHRCEFGLALCYWRLRRFADAAELMQRLLWLNPADNLGVRFVLPAVQARRRWTRRSMDV